VVAPFVSRQPGKKFRHVLKEGLDYLNLKLDGLDLLKFKPGGAGQFKISQTDVRCVDDF
jgi:hypothetical protein